MNCPRCGRILEIGDWPHCPHPRVTPKPHHGVLPSDRTVYLENPATGEVRIPGRADTLSKAEQKYQKLGFVRRDIATGRDMINFERRTGKIHESSNYHRNGNADRDTGAR